MYLLKYLKHNFITGGHTNHSTRMPSGQHFSRCAHPRPPAAPSTPSCARSHSASSQPPHKTTSHSRSVPVFRIIRSLVLHSRRLQHTPRSNKAGLQSVKSVLPFCYTQYGYTLRITTSPKSRLTKPYRYSFYICFHTTQTLVSKNTVIKLYRVLF